MYHIEMLVSNITQAYWVFLLIIWYCSLIFWRRFDVESFELGEGGHLDDFLSASGAVNYSRGLQMLLVCPVVMLLALRRYLSHWKIIDILIHKLFKSVKTAMSFQWWKVRLFGLVAVPYALRRYYLQVFKVMILFVV